MSKNRDNEIWQSPDGSWNLAFYRVIPGDTSDPDYDDEWDVDYDPNEFDWVSTGHRSSDEAWRSWTGVNPGTTSITEYNPAQPRTNEKFDDIAARTYQASRNPQSRVFYRGPAKERVPSILRDELAGRVGAAKTEHKNAEYGLAEMRRRPRWNSSPDDFRYYTDRVERTRQRLDKAQSELDQFDLAHPQVARDRLTQARDAAQARLDALDNSREPGMVSFRRSDGSYEYLSRSNRQGLEDKRAAADERLAWLDKATGTGAKKTPVPTAERDQAQIKETVNDPTRQVTRRAKSQPATVEKKPLARARKSTTPKAPAGDPNRVPAGSSKGGQFAPKTTPEATEVKLDWDP